MNGPGKLKNDEYRFDSFSNGQVVEGKKKQHLPAMGWNSWNAFGSNNTEALTREMADCIVKLGLDKLGYKYIVLDDGCYLPKRVNGELANEPVKFPNGFKALSDYIHSKGLKFGMYNDIGTNLCAGAEVGTCGHEDTDAASYVNWGVDFLKVDNCYYLWDNATFSDATNAKYVYTPAIKALRVNIGDKPIILNAATEGKLLGNGAYIGEDNCVYGLGTLDGTGPDTDPCRDLYSELRFEVEVTVDCDCALNVEYKSGAEPGKGEWLQVAVNDPSEVLYYDDFIKAAEELSDNLFLSETITVKLTKGKNIIRIMNHRRQENTLSSYGKLLEGLNKADPGHDIIYSICEWGKTEPQSWGYKVGDSWRILNDITFAVGNDGDYGKGDWVSDYTNSVTSQYNKAVIMGEFAGLDKGWNDPDMLMIGMNGLNETQYRTHMVMWCMMNSPLMLGLDLRRVNVGDEIYNIIANPDYILLNQDALGIQAIRVKIYAKENITNPNTAYIRDNDRVDALAKPLSDGSIAVSFINLSGERKTAGYKISISEISKYLGDYINAEAYEKADAFECKNLKTGEITITDSFSLSADSIEAYDNITYRIGIKK